ncbi:MAG TPA: class I SAM-dependent methyltransferase [Bacteroidia bacterium]|nr:class I SAM-dependent methyltransferase [Bacteroidia bacterium]
MTLYDQIGNTYNLTRKADPYLAERIYTHLSPKPAGVYMEIGCGTGNYLKALSDKGLKFYGVDPSSTMLEQAKEKNSSATFIQAMAENIPLATDFFDGATAILTFHHWANKLQGLKEINRVLKPGAKFVLFSYTPQQMRGYWLYHYFPKMIERCIPMTPEIPGMEKLFNESGFSLVKTEKYFIRDDLQDQFLYSNKHFPERYLSAEIRNNASAFRAFSDPEEVEQGVMLLEKDIKSGKIKSIISKYENDHGDYLFFVAQKNLKKMAKKNDYFEKAELYNKLIASNPEIECKGATMPYTSLNGNMFSILNKDGTMGLRLPEREREKFIKKYKTKLQEQYGIVQKEYVVVPDDLLKNTKELKKYLDLSFEYAKTLKAKPTTKKK